MDSREGRKAILDSAVTQFLDHLEEDFDEEDEIGSVVICGEVYRDADESTIPTYFSTNENAIWRRGFFEVLADYHRIPATSSDEED